MRFRYLVAVAFVALILGVTAAGVFLYEKLSALEEPIVLSEPAFIELQRGTSFIGLARELERRGFVEDALWMRIRGRLEPELTGIQSGYYQLEPGMSALDLVRRIVRGETHTWSVRLPEGWTFSRIRERLKEQEHLGQVLDEVPPRAVMEKLGKEDMHPEGWFFPASYEYQKGDTDLDVLRQAHERMTSVLSRAWASRADDLPFDSAYEALILASIIELETPLSKEKPRVAGVFVRRLERGMRLQTDPTVIYGMGESYDGRIGSSDLRENTSHNTYRIDGLPPTPIGMPGEAAIQAAVNPAEGEALYFVARGDGSHYFSRTLEEHNKAVRRFQLNRGEDYRSFPAPAPDASEDGTDE
ncbi:UPF0755 protein [Halospina denitrificans]|uniref:Endolytic murein transglycosylase n=1 Tax=Halospina denitrificans TaxID=332522 RepID=A0A4R7JRB2_9GAMM|nr:endolytic transglycosylase MltG [Halospina denitrificans]TDT39369.1 UPF0755 protein [Halospina denitrificans]